jgi:hypothetical protein
MRLHSAIALFIASFLSCHAEQIRILVVEARNGKPVPFECLNVTLGVWHGADILARTDQNGVALITVDSDHLSANLVPGKPCLGIPATKTLSNAEQLTTLSVVPDWYVSCQYSKDQVKDPAWLAETPAQRIPSFAIKEVLSDGAVAANSCSKLSPSPKPGELVLIVRKRTFLEGMKS